MHHRALPAIAVCALAALLAGCTTLRQWCSNGFKVGPNYVSPTVPVQCSWIDADDPRIRIDTAADCSWWTVFNDPTLDGLIETARRQNLDLRTASTRVLDARAQRSIAVGNLFPQSQSAISAYAHGQITQNIGLPIPPNVNIWADGFNASWEADFWGRFRRLIEAQDAKLAASVEQYGSAYVILMSDVARSYVQLRTFEHRLAYARENVIIQQRSLELAETRFRFGKTTELDVHQARSSLAQTESLIPALEVGRRQSANRLCILMGMPVHDLASALPPAPVPVAPPEVAVGIPADLLRRRPDVRAAERQVAAASAQIGIAEADLYPRLSLNGFIGYAADDFADVFSSKSFTAFVLPNAQWNILNYGRIANNIRAQDARLDGAALQYQQAVLTAGREVEDAIVQFLQAQQQTRSLETSVAEAERSVQLVQVQFEGGVTDFNRVFATQSALMQQQDQLATARGTIALALVEIYRAIGGGWQR
jgi:NodT family efflux transporter outer membrane factor (OMF) lipoprotein